MNKNGIRFVAVVVWITLSYLYVRYLQSFVWKKGGSDGDSSSNSGISAQYMSDPNVPWYYYSNESHGIPFLSKYPDLRSNQATRTTMTRLVYQSHADANSASSASSASSIESSQSCEYLRVSTDEVVDENGNLCKLWRAKLSDGCCPKLALRNVLGADNKQTAPANTCDELSCCSSYTSCVSFCMNVETSARQSLWDNAKRVQRVRQGVDALSAITRDRGRLYKGRQLGNRSPDGIGQSSPNASSSAPSLSFSSLQQCSLLCLSNSESLVHENAFRSASIFCFGLSSPKLDVNFNDFKYLFFKPDRQ